MSKCILWSEEETAVLREMKTAGATVPEIMARLSRTKYGIKERWRWLNTDEAEKAKRRQQINLNRNIRAQFGNGVLPTRSAPRIVPDEVTSNRDARIKAGPRDLAGAFFGDPPRGFSALDRKLRGEPDPIYRDHSQAQLQRKPSLAGISA
jgi:hypothetical protein